MVTIKEIAIRAGVSHATVSNVLNHKGNVSAQKIKRVMDVAMAMGYRVNEAASALRSGGANLLAVILPDTKSSAYNDLFLSLCQVAEANGYSTILRLTDNVPGAEYHAIEDVLSSRAGCAVVVTSLPDPLERYAPLIRAGTEVVFALRGAPDGHLCAGFNIAAAAREMVERLLSDTDAKIIALMTNMTIYPQEAAFKAAFLASAQTAGREVTCVQSISSQYAKAAFSLFQAGEPDAIVTTCEEMALAASDAGHVLGKAPRIYTLAPHRLVPSAQYTVFGLNYRRLGKEIAQMLICEKAEKQSLQGSMPGFAPKRFTAVVRNDRHLTLLTAQTPVANALKHLLPRLKQDTGLSLSITMLPTQEVSRTFSQPDIINRFDMARMDLGLMDRWSRVLFTPLDTLDVDMRRFFSQLLPGIAQEYSLVEERPYALPFDPGCHLLFYRKDIITDSHVQREYLETYREPLIMPQSPEAFLRLAQFLDQFSAKQGSGWRGAIITRRSSEGISALMSPGGTWRKLTSEDIERDISRQRSLEKCAAIVENGSWSSAVSRFEQGECALMIAHSNYARHLADQPLSSVSGRVGYAPAPGGKAFLGGGVIGVLEASGQKEEASVFLSWLLSHKISGLVALLSGCSPWTEAYENEELSDIYPWLGMVREGLSNGTRRKLFSNVTPPHDSLTLEKEITRLCGLALRGVLSPEKAAEQINALKLYADK